MRLVLVGPHGHRRPGARGVATAAAAAADLTGGRFHPRRQSQRRSAATPVPAAANSNKRLVCRTHNDGAPPWPPHRGPADRCRPLRTAAATAAAAAVAVSGAAARLREPLGGDTMTRLSVPRRGQAAHVRRLPPSAHGRIACTIHAVRWGRGRGELDEERLGCDTMSDQRYGSVRGAAVGAGGGSR